MRAAPLCLTAAFGLAVGCLGSSSKSSLSTGGSDGGGGTQDSDAGVGSAVDLATGPDLTPHPLPVDLGSTDLAGFVNCFGATVCDPTSSFCIRLNSGSAANPGTTQSPACYQPVDCMGATMDCNCITQDPVLGGSCVNCVDHMDGTYDCYAQ